MGLSETIRSESDAGTVKTCDKAHENTIAPDTENLAVYVVRKGQGTQPENGAARRALPAPFLRSHKAEP